MRGFFTKRAIRGPVLFVVLAAAMPRAPHAMFFFYTTVLEFRPTSVALASVVPHCWAVAGMVAYYGVFSGLDLRMLFLTVGVVVSVITTLPLIMITRVTIALGISDAWFIPMDDGLAAAALEVMVLPISALCARSCPQHLEGTVLATIMAAYHFGLFCSGQLGGLLTAKVVARESVTRL